MEAKTCYQFPNPRDERIAKDGNWASVPVNIAKYANLKNNENSKQLLILAWAILVFVYEEAETTKFKLIRNRETTTGIAAINHDQPWEDIRLQYEDGEETDVINTGVCVFAERNIEIPAELQTALIIQCLDDLTVSMAFRPDIVSDAHAVNISSTFEKITDALSGPNIPIGAMDVLSEHNLDQISKFSTGPRNVKEDHLHSIIENQALETPDQIAVDAWDMRLTYKELDLYASVIAKRLKSLNAANTYVPMCAEKSAWAVVAMVGILKAGAACSPLEPSHPRDRLESMIQSCGATTVVVTATYASLFQMEGTNVVVVSSESISPTSEELGLIDASVTTRSPAFLMWTSGSTGNPKGVVLEHAALYMSITAYAEASEFTAKTRTFQFTSFTFTVSICDIFGTMARGGTLCMPSDEQRLNDLTGALRDSAASFCWLTSTSLTGLDPDKLPDLRCVTVGGESLSRDVVARWAGKCQINVSYGTTETCGWCLLNPNLRLESDSRVLGKPIIPAAWICHPDDIEKLVPVGAVGELLIEGPFLAREYLDDAERTAAQFIQPPTWMERFRPGESTRLYRTNDLVRYTSDGSVRFVGRKQAHAKIRGNRINLIDIEHHVRRALGTSEAVVDVVHTKDGVDMLAAFLLASSDASMNQGSESPVTQGDDAFRQQVASALQTLETTLPSYMVPTAFIPLSRMPLTRTNKTDRRLLREESGARTRSELVQLSVYKAENVGSQLSRTESIMQQLWSELTGLATENIGPDDSFFHLGGDSVMAIRLVPLAKKHGIVFTVMDMFRYSKLRDLAAYINDRGEDERTEMNFSSLETGDLVPDAARECGVDIDAIEDLYPCTALQEGLMALSAQRAGAYVLQMACDIPLTAELFRFLTAWETVFNSLPILRTRIVQLGQAGFHQAVIKEKIDWRSVTSEEEWREWTHMHPMQLGCPLARFALLQVNSRPTRILIAVHHSIFDRWSSSILLEMVDKLYQGQEVRQQAFKDFVEYVHSRPAESSDAFWENYLRDAQHTAFPHVQDTIHLPKPSMRKNKAIQLGPSRSNFTATTKLRLCWALVLAQHTDNTDVVFGAVSTGRSAPVEGIESLVGPTLATVPFRVRMNLGSSVADALDAVQSDSASILPNEQRGLQNIAKVSADTKSACKFENILIVHAPHSGGGMALLGDMADDQLPELFSYALTLSCEVIGQNQVHVDAFFDPRIIGERYVETLLCQLDHAMRQIQNVPDCRLGDISVLSANDELLLKSWSSALPESAHLCVHDSIRDQCAAAPDAEAVCSWDGSFSYGTLEDLSTSLAVQLHHRGIGPEVFVPLLFEKSKWTVVAMLGVMKAGGAFLPLDPSFPNDRLEMICHQVGAGVILASRDLSGRAKSLVASSVVVDDRLKSIPASSIILPTTDPASALYAVFTSGSTGKPKGVVIQHVAYASGAEAHMAAASITSESRVLQFSSYAFDASIIEHLTTLMAGGCICIISDKERSDSLSEAVVSRNANFTWQTPSVVRTMNPKDYPSLKHLCLIGEAIGPTEIGEWTKHLKLMQAYGPAECSVLATLRAFLNLDSDPRNIGFPTGCTGWVVDKEDHARLAPVGAVGELLIEGPIVARGYHGSPEQTEAAFVNAPDWMHRYRKPGSPRSRLYKTGDLVQYASELDGTLLYISRKDTQVKIRGQRMELSEVEYHVREAMEPSSEIVAEVVQHGTRNILTLFFADKFTANEQRGDCLVMSMKDDTRSEVAKIKHELTTRLPNFMIPTAWIPVSRIPLSASTKTDRRRLRLIGESISVEQFNTYVIDAKLTNGSASDGSLHVCDKPMTEEELLLHELICEVLESQGHKIIRNAVTMDEQFTSIGGDSLTALALVSRAKKIGFTFTAADVIVLSMGELASKRA